MSRELQVIDNNSMVHMFGFKGVSFYVWVGVSVGVHMHDVCCRCRGRFRQQYIGVVGKIL